MTDEGKVRFPCHNCGKTVEIDVELPEEERMERKSAFGTQTVECPGDKISSGCGAPVTAVVTLYHNYPNNE